MKKDVDYVGIGDYTADMRHLADLGSAVIKSITKERDEAWACIAALVKAAGRIEIPDDFSIREPQAYEMVQNPCDRTLIFKALTN